MEAMEVKEIYTPIDQQERKRVGQLEEIERQRRISDHDEAVSRKVKAQDVSDAIRRESTTIKARFLSGPSMWQRGKSALAAMPSAGRRFYDAVSAAPAAASKYLPVAAGGVKDTAIASNTAAENVASALSGAYDTAKSVTTSAASYLPSLSSVMNTANSIKDRVIQNIPFMEHPITLANVKILEEIERQRRIKEDKSSNAIGNAHRLAMLIRFSKDIKPHKTHPSGFHNYTNSIEEDERIRRLANKGSEETRRMLAFKVASVINQLGWPFIRGAKGNVPSTQVALLAEEERRRILGDQPGMLHSRYNSGKIASLIKDVFKPHDYAPMRSYTRSLEEKERRHRMKCPDISIHNAHKQAVLIRNIGAPFYVPSSSLSDEIEQLDYRKARNIPAEEPSNLRKQARKAAKQANKEQWPKGKKERQLAQEFVQEQPKNFDTAWMEEDERKSRIADKEWQHVAFANAQKVAALINKRKGPYKQRIAAYKPDAFVLPITSTISPPSAPVLPIVKSVPPQTTQPAANLEKNISAAPSSIPPVSQPSSTSHARPTPTPHPVPGTTSAPLTQPHVSVVPCPITATPQPAPNATSGLVTQQAAFSQPPTSQHGLISQGLFSQKLPGSPYPTHSQLNNAAQQSNYSTPLSSTIVNYPPASSYTSFPAPSSAATNFPQPAAPIAPATAPIAKPVEKIAPVFTKNEVTPIAKSETARDIPVVKTEDRQIAPVAKPVQASTASPASQPTISSKPAGASVVAAAGTAIPPASRTTSAPIFTAPPARSSVPAKHQQESPTGYNKVGRTHWTPESKEKLIDNVQKLMQTEQALADQERQKAASLRNKSGPFAKFRMHKHENLALKHGENAKRHQDWLRQVNPPSPAMSAL